MFKLKMKILSFTLVLLGLSLSSFYYEMHEYYFSVMTMEKNEEAQSLEVEFRFFADDLEKAIGQTEDYFIRLGDEREVPEADSLIFEYLYDHVTIRGNGWENASFSYVGKEVKNGYAFIYAEYLNIEEWGNVQVNNSILFEHFEGQINQLSVINGKNVYTQECYKDYPERTVNLNP